MTALPGFDDGEYRARTEAAQRRMNRAGIDALLLTTEPDVRYFSGFLTRFWESPTRPWFLIVPASGNPVAVIPEIGAHLMAQTWLDDIRTWPAPDFADDGVQLLAETLLDIAGPSARIGLPSGPETHLRMSLDAFEALKARLPRTVIAGDQDIVRSLRIVKSPVEIARIEAASTVAGRAFDRMPEIAGHGTALSDVFRGFQRLCLEEGADWVPYLAGGAGPSGYGDVISPAKNQPLEHGDVLMLDTGSVLGGYFTDFNRNFAVGPVSGDAASAHGRLLDAVDAGAGAARSGARACDVFAAMDRVLTNGAGSTGRYGHGLGMQLTEWPSVHAGDPTELRPGMVITLEPAIATGPSRLMVHEEVIVITDAAPRFLSPRMEGPMPALP